VISIRLSLHTEFGPVGPRLERGVPMPKPPYDFPDTPEGREAAEAKREEILRYIERTRKK
jgi:hypothetical protein